MHNLHNTNGKHNVKREEIGRTLANDRFISTMDSFWFSISSDIVINPFDFVTVGHIFNTRTIGIVKELQASDIFGTVPRTAIMANTGIEKIPGKVLPIAMPVRPAKPVKITFPKEPFKAG